MKPVWFGSATIAALGLVLSTLADGRAAEAGRVVGVVELFTSQGCNSCPPADDVLARLGQQGDIVALGYHVDYWDYLGWSDTLATPENTARQNDYRRSFGNRSVYTPQAIINGRIDVNGAKHDTVVDALKTFRSTGKGLEVDVSIVRDGDSIVIAAGKAAGGISDAHVVLVFFSAVQAVDIKKGENGGRRVVYWNPVTGIQAVGMWHGAAARFELPASEIVRKGKGGGLAVLLQEVASDGAPGAIVGAAIMSNGAI